MKVVTNLTHICRAFPSRSLPYRTSSTIKLYDKLRQKLLWRQWPIWLTFAGPSPQEVDRCSVVPFISVRCLQPAIVWPSQRGISYNVFNWGYVTSLTQGQRSKKHSLLLDHTGLHNHRSPLGHSADNPGHCAWLPGSQLLHYILDRKANVSSSIR